jgi:hypothetical protein
MTRQEEIERVHGNGTHVVIIGAGASLASTIRNPEKNGKQLPLMKNIVDIIGLNDIISKLPSEVQLLKNDFEKLYSVLNEEAKYSDGKKEIELRVYDYFKNMSLPKEPTIYDYLILSLRHEKDVIASFNWDPFLYQAYNRNGGFVKSPSILFLHGNFAIGFNKIDGSSGPAGLRSKLNYGYFEPTKVLFPVNKKDYVSDEYIKGQWEALKYELKHAERVTVFGYSAPSSDVEALNLLKTAWGTPNERNMEEFEFIDIQEEKEVIKSWKSFIHSHHYSYHKSFFESSIAHHPRRSVESYHHWSMPMTFSESFQDGNLVPNDFTTLQELWDWYRPLINAEKAFITKALKSIKKSKKIGKSNLPKRRTRRISKKKKHQIILKRRIQQKNKRRMC